MNEFVWLIRREIWENRAIWIVPAAIGAALVLAALFGHVDVDLSNPAGQTATIGGVLLFAFGIVFLLVMSIYSAWYLLDSLYADRKDRSILFWKSLPITDAATVLAKLATALLVIPLVYFALADLTTLIIAFIVSLRARAWVGPSLWRADLWLQLQALWLYLIATMAVWFLPVSGWFLLVSAWARRAVTLWSVLPPLALVWAERSFLGTHHVADVLGDRLFAGYLRTAFNDLPGSLLSIVDASGGGSRVASTSVWGLLDPIGFLRSPATWIGAAVGAALVAAAIRVRARSVEL